LDRFIPSDSEVNQCVIADLVSFVDFDFKNFKGYDFEVERRRSQNDLSIDEEGAKV